MIGCRVSCMLNRRCSFTRIHAAKNRRQLAQTKVLSREGSNALCKSNIQSYFESVAVSAPSIGPVTARLNILNSV
jgi:hypothetical protein